MRTRKPAASAHTSAFVLRQGHLKLGDEDRHSMLRCRPYSIPIYFLETMNQAMTHTNNAVPINLRVLGACRIGYVPCRFAN